MAAHFRELAITEPLASLRRHLRLLAAQHEEAADLEIAKSTSTFRAGQTPGSIANE
jgi:hypothetical protein